MSEAIERGQAMLDEYTADGGFMFKRGEAPSKAAIRLWYALADLVEEAKARERLLVIASDYLSQHWDMDSAPLNEIAEAATQEANDG